MQPTHNFVRAVGNHFEIDGHEFRFVGFNIRGLAHYGFNDFLPLSTTAQRTEVLAEAQAVGSLVIRIFLPFHTLGDAELVNRLRIVLDNAVIYQQRVIVCFTDHFESIKCQHWSPFSPVSPRDRGRAYPARSAGDGPKLYNRARPGRRPGPDFLVRAIRELTRAIAYSEQLDRIYRINRIIKKNLVNLVDKSSIRAELMVI